MVKLLKSLICLFAFGFGLVLSPVSAETTNEIELNLPQHMAVCVDGRVSKRKLAGFILATVGTKNADILPATIRDADAWREIFTDSNFCRIPKTCDDSSKTDECMAAAKCKAARSLVVQAGNRFFVLLNSTANAAKHVYVESQSLAHLADDPDAQRKHYFDDKANANYITCGPDNVAKATPPFDPAKDPVLSNFRVRGSSDELYIGRDQYLFKGTSSATGSFSGDTNTAHTYTTKVTGAFGYAFGADTAIQAVPYVSLYQSLTDAAGKPLVFDPNDNVAGGVLLQSYFNTGGLSNVVSVKPQYLLYTSNHAELASVRAVYTPTMDIPFNVNTFTHLDFLPGSPWWEFVFNLRSDTGNYTNRGNTPAIVAVNSNFERVGGQIGFALSTDGISSLPSVTLLVTETYLYGLSGFYRQMNLFQSSLTYNFANSYLGLTASYKKGQDEDTAVKSQVWLLGLSGHY